jgi:hypothetical protein
MGANAQTSVPTFVASQVLTAEQQNQSARTGVPVFSTTGTRDAAFGGSGEKTLAEGQLAYVEGTGLQTYNGTSWVTWGTAPASGALVLVKAETSFSAASSVIVDNVFSSTYTNYLVLIRYETGGSGVELRMRLRVGGVSAATNYNFQQIIFDNTTSFSGRGASQTSMVVSGQTNGVFKSAAYAQIFSPNVAEPTNFIIQNAPNQGAYTTPQAGQNSGNHSDSTAYTGFELLTTSSNTTGFYTVYGYAKS